MVAETREDVAPRRARAWLLAICGVALLLRVAYVLQSRASPLFDAPQMDAAYHWDWARAFARGEDFQPGPFFRAPLYPWFLGLCVRVFGESFLAPRLVQAVLGTLSVALVYRLAALAFDRRTGLVASAIAATYWTTIYFEGELLLPVLEVLCDLVAIERTIVAGARARKRDWLVAGVAWGVAALVRPNVLLGAPLIALWSARRSDTTKHEAWRTRVARALVFAAGLALPIAPITAYNAIEGRDRVLVSSQGGVNFWIGNNPASDGSSAIVPGTRPDWWGGYHDAIALAEREEGRALRPSEVSSHYTRKALDWMRAHPLDALRHLAWKTRLFWLDFELGNNQDERFFALEYGPVLRVLPITFGVLAPLALLGLVVTGRRAWRLWPLWSFAPIYAASIVAFFVCARFRVPVVPVLIVFAAHAVLWAIAAWRARRTLALAGAAALVAVAAFASWTLPASLDRTHAQGWYQVGLIELERGRFREAEAAFRRGRDERPSLAILHQGLGMALRGLGRDAEARASFEEAVRLDVRAASEAEAALVEMDLASGAFDAARARAEELEAALPSSAIGPQTAGRVAFARWGALVASHGDPRAIADELERARAAFDRALALPLAGAETFAVPYSAARVAEERRDEARAVELFERALAGSKPDSQGYWFDALRRLAAALRRAGRASEVPGRVAAHLARAAGDPRVAAVERELLGPR